MARTVKQVKALVTCGPTYVPIDDVRVVSNISSGQLGHLIAQALMQHGVDVTLLEGPVTHSWINEKVRRVKYTFLNELTRLFQREIKKSYDIVIHAAAVSDFKVKQRKGKLDSSKSQYLELIPAGKLIKLVKKHSPGSFLVGFKLQTSLPKAVTESAELLVGAKCDLVVANTFRGNYKAAILDKNRIIARGNTKEELADKLVRILCRNKAP